jgi:HSP20 family molecular chaperone IbpA
MQSKHAITMLSTALVLGIALVGWQTWNAQQMKNQLGQLQVQLAALQNAQQGATSSQLAGVPNNGPGTTASPMPGQSRPPAQVSPVQPGSVAPVNPQANGLADPFGFNGGNRDPFAEFDRIQQQMHARMQQLMSGNGFADPFLDFDVFGSGGFGFSSSFGRQDQPQFTYSETEEAYVVTVEIPQGSNIELNTEVQGQELTISGKVTVEENNSSNGAAFTSRQTQQFAQTFSLPADVDPLGITNETRDSTIVITIPRSDVPASLAGPNL